MKLLFDQNISPKILKFLPKEFSESQQVRFVKLENASDNVIFQYARQHEYVIVTFDSDFIDLNAIRGTPPKIIWLNTGNMTTKRVSEMILKNISTIKLYCMAESDDILELLK